MTRRETDELQGKIELLLLEHMAEQRKAAMVSISRAFEGMTPPTRSQRLYEAVGACPGETMTVIAERVGEKWTTLNLPMLRLKQEGRVQSTGERNRTRYFPMEMVKSA